MKKQLIAGNFEIQGEISKGQTGTIYYGYDMDLRQEVAIKIYHSHINGRLIRGDAFIEKSKPLLLLEHPNLIKIFKVEKENDTPVVFMEFFDAPSLQQMIRDKSPLPVSEMLMLAREITEVLVHTHFQGIIHGTLHPGHVLVGPQGQIKVMDLGLSWILMDILSNCDEELLRPLPYFPPEVAKGELLNVSSDIYCLGFMMYEMLTGTVPYAGLPKTSIMGKLAFDQTDPTLNFPDGVPEAICDLIRDMTRNKAQQRLQDATHVLTVINQQLSKFPGKKVSAMAPPPASQPQVSLQETPSEPCKASLRTAPPANPEPPLNETPSPQLPNTSMDDSKIQYTKLFRNVGMIFGLIVLVAGSGVFGFWFRDFLDPRISVSQTQLDHAPQSTQIPLIEPPQPEVLATPSQPVMNKQNALAEARQPRTQKAESLKAPNIIPVSTRSVPTSISQKSEEKFGQPTSTEPSSSNKADEEPSLPLTQKPPAPIKTPAPAEEQPSKTPPATLKLAPRPAAETTKRESKNQTPFQKPVALSPTNETIPPVTTSVQLMPTQAKKTEDLTDEEIDELLRALDKSANELSSLTVP